MQVEPAMRVLLIHPTGNQNSRQLAIGLADRGRLQEFATALALPAALTNCSLLPASLRMELARRSFQTGEQMRSVAASTEIARLVRMRLRGNAGRSAVDDLYVCVDQRAAKRIHRLRPTHVYAYEDGALESFHAARAVGAHTVYELPIGHWEAHRAICDAEREARPEWADTWSLSAEPAAKLVRKDTELKMADLVIVPSDFVKSTLLRSGIPLEKIAVVPYGCPSPLVGNQREAAAGTPLRVLFVGGLSQRKGLSDLVASTAPFGRHVEVTVIGRGPARALLPASWRVIDSLPHAQVLAEMRRHDVFVFPTRFEGRSLAVAEAVSCGLVLITTLNSGAADLVDEGVNGWITEIGDSANIASKLELLLQKPALLQSMKGESIRIARNNSWNRYRENINARLSAMEPR